jgi:hypothetical protein
MAFDEYPEAFLWRCDHCGYEVAFKPHDFYACVAELKARGWTFNPPERRGVDTWGHRCGRCRKPLAEMLKMPLKEVGR